MASEYRPTRAQTGKALNFHSAVLAFLICAFVALTYTLVRKGVITWDDLANMGTASG